MLSIMPKLTLFNGSEITTRERTNSERLYLSLWLKRKQAEKKTEEGKGKEESTNASKAEESNKTSSSTSSPNTPSPPSASAEEKKSEEEKKPESGGGNTEKKSESAGVSEKKEKKGSEETNAFITILVAVDPDEAHRKRLQEIHGEGIIHGEDETTGANFATQLVELTLQPVAECIISEEYYSTVVAIIAMLCFYE
jgi:hypothetical protein